MSVDFKKLAKVLSTEAREHIKGKNFALPGRRYPIEDKAHARNALARVAQHGSPEEQATVQAKVHSKYPDIGSDKTASVDRERIERIVKLAKAKAAMIKCGSCGGGMTKCASCGTMGKCASCKTCKGCK